MNIIVKPYGSETCYCRPDTTWERENKDFYSPECVDDLYWTPVLFARISKAGKCIGRKFTSRYYDAVGFGALLYIGKGDVAFTSCADHTSLLPMPLYNPSVLEGTENIFEVFRNGESFRKYNSHDKIGILEESICKASALTSLRIGDMVALELAPMQNLASRTDGSIEFRSTYCDNELFDISILF